MKKKYHKVKKLCLVPIILGTAFMSASVHPYEPPPENLTLLQRMGILQKDVQKRAGCIVEGVKAEKGLGFNQSEYERCMKGWYLWTP